MDSLTAEAARDTGSFRALPDEAPLAMPIQDLRSGPGRNAGPGSMPWPVITARIFVLGGTVALTAAAEYQMYRVMQTGGLTLLEILVLLLFLVLFAWIALAFLNALAGFASLLAGGGSAPCTGPLPALSTRTALLMPTYNEAPARVMAGIQAMHESLAAAGALAWFDFFILSDTTDSDIWIAEEAGFLELRRRTGGHGRIFYRRRPQNLHRKSGNIAEWVRRFGDAYPQMLVLDADSLMTGEAIIRLAGAMERDPRLGLIQTMPVIAGATTLFARLMQFAGRIYGPLVAHGLAAWHGAESNYWGHNAIIRTRAFAGCAGLPELPGRKPFGGPILSHDFVEAALLRRAGWAVHAVPALPGSYEECPPTLPEMEQRDRRWCQGNLQHMAVIGARGLQWISRLHLATGIASYLSAPLWLLFLIAGMLLSLEAGFIRPDYFPPGHSLFPVWPVIDPVRSKWLFVGTMGVLLAPKLLGFIAMLAHREWRRGCGGPARALLSVTAEILLSGLIAPAMMLTQSRDVAAILSGRDAGWKAQRREAGQTSFRESVRRYRAHLALGLLLAAASFAVSPFLLAWMAPVLLGLLLAGPVAFLTGSERSGIRARRLGLLAIPEERDEPGILARAHLLRARFNAASPISEAVARLARDPALLRAHRLMLPEQRRPGLDPINVRLLVGRTKAAEAGTLGEVLASLTGPEKTALLADQEGLETLIDLAAWP